MSYQARSADPPPVLHVAPGLTLAREPCAPMRTKTPRPPTPPTRGPESKRMKKEETKLSDALVPNPDRRCWACHGELKPRALYFCRACYLQATTRRKVRLARKREAKPDGDPRVVQALHREAEPPKAPFDPYTHFPSLSDAARYERALRILRVRPATAARLAKRLGLEERDLAECLGKDPRIERVAPRRGGPKRYRLAA